VAPIIGLGVGRDQHVAEARHRSGQTPLPAETPAALTPAYADEKAVQWTAFLRRTELAAAPEPFPAIQAQIAELVMPPTLALNQGATFDAVWTRGGPWTDGL